MTDYDLLLDDLVSLHHRAARDAEWFHGPDHRFYAGCLDGIARCVRAARSAAPGYRARYPELAQGGYD